MNRKALGVLAIAIIIMMVMVFMVGDGGLSKRTEALAAAELASFTSSRSTFDRMAGDVNRAIEQETAFFSAGGYDRAWSAAIEAGRADLAKAESAADALKVILDADDKKQDAEAVTQIQRVNSSRVAALAAVEGAVAESRKLLSFKAELPDRIATMEADHSAIVAVDLGPITTRVRQARADWPGKDADLKNRLAVIEASQSDVGKLWGNTASLRDAANSNTIEPDQLVELAQASEMMSRSRVVLSAAPARLGSLVDQLYWSWDKILADMEIVEGYEVGFKHLYRTVRTPVQQSATGMFDRMPGAEIIRTTFRQPDPADGEEVVDPNAAGVKTTEQWVTVSKVEFEKLKQNLGMVVQHKDAGKYDHEAESLVQPAGYQYVAPYGQRNRYGYWNGGFWRFYGQYAFMRDVFWGRGHRLGRSDWDGYNRSRSTGTTYYGKDSTGRSKYGSSGTATTSRYSGSKYVSTGGYKNSQYVRSGGTYKGSRYSSSSSRSSSSRSTRSSRSGGFSRSGGRSGGK